MNFAEAEWGRSINFDDDEGKKIEVGTSGIIKCYSTRIPVEVIKVGKNTKRITVRFVKANTNGYFPEAVFSLRKNGKFVEVGDDVDLGAVLIIK